MLRFSPSRLRNFATSFDRALATAEAALLSSAVLAMAALNIGNVLSRNLLNRSLGFTEELNRLLIIIVTFAGIGFAARAGRHIRMTALSERLRGRPGQLLERMTLAATGALLLSLAWLALDYVGRTAAVGSVTPALRVPLHLVYAVVPLGLAIGGLRFLWDAARTRSRTP